MTETCDWTVSIVDNNLFVDIALYCYQRYRDFEDAANYNERSRNHADRMLSREQFASAEAYRNVFIKMYDNVLKPMGLTEKVDKEAEGVLTMG